MSSSRPARRKAANIDFLKLANGSGREEPDDDDDDEADLEQEYLQYLDKEELQQLLKGGSQSSACAACKKDGGGQLIAVDEDGVKVLSRSFGVDTSSGDNARLCVDCNSQLKEVREKMKRFAKNIKQPPSESHKDSAGVCLMCSSKDGDELQPAAKLKWSGITASAWVKKIMPELSSPSPESVICSTCVPKLKRACMLHLATARAKKELLTTKSKKKKRRGKNKAFSLSKEKFKADLDLLKRVTVKVWTGDEDQPFQDYQQVESEDEARTAEEDEESLIVHQFSDILEPADSSSVLDGKKKKPVLYLTKSCLALPLSRSKSRSIGNYFDISNDEERFQKMGVVFRLSKDSSIAFEMWTKGALMAHEELSIPKDAFFCQICQQKKSFNDFPTILDHIVGKHATLDMVSTLTSLSQLSCPECKETFLGEKALAKHKKSFHSSPQNLSSTCRKCGESFSIDESYIAHFKDVHPDSKPFQCEVCDKTFTRKASMAEHLKRHKGERNKECTICHKMFYSTSYWRHMSSVHTKEEKLVFKCKYCPKKFAQKFRLVKHEVVHVSYDQREHVCPRCPEKRFSHLNGLRTHMRLVHVETAADRGDGDPLLCSDCGMTFQTATSLAGHKRRHHPTTDEKRHECCNCPMTFNSSSLLSSHWTAVHTQPKTATPKSSPVKRRQGVVDSIEVEAEGSQLTTTVSLDMTDTDHENDGKCIDVVEDETEEIQEEQSVETQETIVHIHAMSPRRTSITTTSTFIPPTEDQMKQELAQKQSEEDAVENELRRRILEEDSRKPKPSPEPEPMNEADIACLPELREDGEGGHILTLSQSDAEALLAAGAGGQQQQQLLVRTAEGDFIVPIETAAAASFSGIGEGEMETLVQQPTADAIPFLLPTNPLPQEALNLEMPAVTLKQEERDPDDVKLYCTTCDRYFKNAKSRQQHFKMVHSTTKLSCPQCNRSFNNAKYLREHCKTHSLEKPFKCQMCDSAFKVAKDLARHNRVHTGEKPYKCPDCPKSFSHTSNLSEHRTIHTGRKPYQCENCLIQFRIWSSFNKHRARCKMRRLAPKPPSKEEAAASSVTEVLVLESGNILTINQDTMVDQ